MKFCDQKECEYDACCNHCEHMVMTDDIRYECKYTNSEVDPLDLCDEFECFRIKNN